MRLTRNADVKATRDNSASAESRVNFREAVCFVMSLTERGRLISGSAHLRVIIRPEGAINFRGGILFRSRVIRAYESEL